ncbi:MAG: hypothetical protein Q4G09_02435 [Clostridia bacterium]|nr:hypothetical protein [Clostridia bacterium]
MKIIGQQENTTKQVLIYLKDISKSINSVISLLENSSLENKSEIINELCSVNEVLDKKNTATVTKSNKPATAKKQNTLFISYSDNTVILPYTTKELNKILKDSKGKYKTKQDVIDDLYTIPLDYYHNNAFSRFKEAFKLIREREHGSLPQALDLALEMFSNYNLHPAIITACKNINELDVYLSCLEYNELKDFHFFNIQFNMPPSKIKKTK